MSHRSRRPIRIAIAIAIVCLSALPGTATAAVDSPTSSNVAAPLSAPIDETGVTFHGFRSNGYPLVPGSAFWLEARTTVPAGPVHFAEVIDGSPSDLGEVSWADGGTVNGVQIRLADLSVPGPSAGEHHYQAIIDATL